MERLTVKAPSGLIHLKHNDTRFKSRAIKVLSDYEDTGLTPQEIQELKERDTAKAPVLKSDGDWDGEPVYDTWICPNCEEEYEVDYDDYDFCPKCGQKILK